MSRNPGHRSTLAAVAVAVALVGSPMVTTHAASAAQLTVTSAPLQTWVFEVSTPPEVGPSLS